MLTPQKRNPGLSDSGVSALPYSSLGSSSATAWCQTKPHLAVLQGEHSGRKQHRPLLGKPLPAAPVSAQLLTVSAALRFPGVVWERDFLMCYLPPQILFSLHSASKNHRQLLAALWKEAFLWILSSLHISLFHKTLKKMQYSSGQNFSLYHTHFSKLEERREERGSRVE